jgi:NAD(P)H-hydrate epimerase
MREVDLSCYESHGIPSLDLMKTAGRKTALIAGRMIEEDGDNQEILVVCGRGNNGGDGLACALELTRMGIRTRAVLLVPLSTLKGDPLSVLQEAMEADVPIKELQGPEDLGGYLKECPGETLLVDAIFGTGFIPPARNGWASAISAVNAGHRPVVSIDLPSGLDADSGSLPETVVKAACTVTLGAPKAALFVYPAAETAGEVVVADIGHPLSLIEDNRHTAELLDSSWCRKKLVNRSPNTHKGTYGHLLLAAGSERMPGAALLTALGALRSGAGLVTLAVPEPLDLMVPAFIPEAMPLSLPADPEGSFSPDAAGLILPLSGDMGAMAAGPGLGTGKGAAALVGSLVKNYPDTLILDADALNVLARETGSLSARKGPTVITPHPGELGRLLDTATAEIQKDRLSSALAAVSKFGHLTALKGAGTIIVSPDGRLLVNISGNPGMASGGMGDVLTGMIAGFAVQGFSPLEAAGLGIYLHGLAGDLAAEEMGPVGFLARDVAERVPAAICLVLEGYEDLEKI